jgi:bifunctional UDP-N-acetylglucosamine pyrophosphorylase/glucosamine-1-phosphate N-acetyltransferase
MTLAVVILAAGQGTRMQSRKQKILHEVGGKPMVAHAFAAAEAVADLPPVLVVAPGETAVRELLGDAATYVAQPEPLGTGDAARQAASALRGRADQVIVTYADMPLLRAETLALLAERQRATGAAVVLLVVAGPPDSPFGRVVRRDDGRVREIVEVAEARRRPDAAALLALPDLNAGVYCFDGDWLWDTIDDLPLRQARGNPEYYLTDMIGLAVAQERPVEAVVLADPEEGLGAGTRAELVGVERAFRRRAANHWLAHGVTLIDPDAIYIDTDVVIGQDTVIWPNTYLQGRTTIGADCVIGPLTVLRDAALGDGCRVAQAVVEGVHVPDGTVVPPFSHLSPTAEPQGEQTHEPS